MTGKYGIDGPHRPTNPHVCHGKRQKRSVRTPDWYDYAAWIIVTAGLLALLLYDCLGN